MLFEDLSRDSEIQEEVHHFAGLGRGGGNGHQHIEHKFCEHIGVSQCLNPPKSCDVFLTPCGDLLHRQRQKKKQKRKKNIIYIYMVQEKEKGGKTGKPDAPPPKISHQAEILGGHRLDA